MKTRSRKRTETTVEAHEVWVVRGAARASAAWCRECKAPAMMLTPEDAARVSNVAPRTLYRLVEAGRVHFREVDGGWLLICLASLPVEDSALTSPSVEPPASG